MTFPLVGNEKIKYSVSAWTENRRIPHAVLIEGEVCSGRHTLAAFLAQAAVCEGENPPCGKCRGCSLALSLNHPDIIITAPESGKKNIAVSQVRALKSEAYIKPHSAERKVFIIDRADTLNEQSQNALLKVLEEPPQAAMFILIAETKASFLDTIISRCAVVSLSVPERQAALQYIKSKTDFSESQILKSLEISKNNIGKALKILQGNTVKTEESAREFLEAMLRTDEFSMLTVLSRFEKDRVGAEEFFKELKYAIELEIRKNPKGFRTKALMKFYSEISSFEQSLYTNINLNLLFCSAVCTAKQNLEEL